MFSQIYRSKALIITLKVFLVFIILSIIGSVIIGPILVFSTNIGNAVAWYNDVSLDFLILYIFGFDSIQFNLGITFMLLWMIYSIYLIYCFYKPISITKLGHLVDIIFDNSFKKKETKSYNYLIITIFWFSAYFVISIFIDVIQQLFGINLGSPLMENPLLSFFYLTAAPLNEEIFFRVLLLGLPLFLIFVSFNRKGLLTTLNHPYQTIPLDRHKLTISLIIVFNSLFFGLSHLIFGGGYEIGKITQASLGGLILGWLYYRYGLGSAIIFHWMSNYVLFTYSLLGFLIFGTPWNTESDNIFLIFISICIVFIGIYFLITVLKNNFKKLDKKIHSKSE